jgi:hypothetical protein
VVEVPPPEEAVVEDEADEISNSSGSVVGEDSPAAAAASPASPAPVAASPAAAAAAPSPSAADAPAAASMNIEVQIGTIFIHERKILRAIIVVDMSASMLTKVPSGESAWWIFGTKMVSRATLAKAGCRNIVRKLLSPTDVCRLSVFNDDVTTVFDFQNPDQIQWDAVEALKPKPNGSTNMFGAIKSAMENLQQNNIAGVINYLFIVTDGADKNHLDPRCRNEVASLLINPGVSNFNFCMLAINMDPEHAAVYKSEFCSESNAHFVEGSDGNIPEAFNRVNTIMERTVNGMRVSNVTDATPVRVTLNHN